MDTIIIDEGAARSDISHMKAAIGKLQQSAASIQQLINTAETMKGQTGTAIEEKARDMQHRIRLLIGQLESSIAVVERTIRMYQEWDAKQAKLIGK